MGQLKQQLRWIGRAQVGLALLATAVIATACFALFRPARAQLQSLRGRTVDTQTQLAAGLSHTSILPAVQADVERLRNELDRSKRLPHQKELSQFIGDIAQLAAQSQLGKFDLKPGTPVHDDRFNQLPMAMSFEGDFMSAFNFLRKTEQLAQLTRVRGLDIQTKDKAGQVKVQLTLLIYFDTE